MSWWQWCLVLFVGAYALLAVFHVLSMACGILRLAAHEAGESPFRMTVRIGLGFILGAAVVGLPVALGSLAYLGLVDGLGWHWSAGSVVWLVVAGGIGCGLLAVLDRHKLRR